MSMLIRKLSSTNLGEPRDRSNTSTCPSLIGPGNQVLVLDHETRKICYTDWDTAISVSLHISPSGGRKYHRRCAVIGSPDQYWEAVAILRPRPSLHFHKTESHSLHQ